MADMRALRAGVWIAAFAAWAGAAGAQELTVENNIDYYGGDYTSFEPAKPDAGICRDACAKDAKCIAYTFLRPADKKAKGRCFLKSTMGKRTPNKCCISGVRKAPAQAQAPVKAPVQTQNPAVKQPTQPQNQAIPQPADPKAAPKIGALLPNLADKIFKAPDTGTQTTTTVPAPAPAPPQSAPAPGPQANLAGTPAPALSGAVQAPSGPPIPATLLERLTELGLTPRSRRMVANGQRAEVDVGPGNPRRIGPVRRACPERSPEDEARFEQERQAREQRIYQACISGSTRGGGDIPSEENAWHCQTYAQEESVLDPIDGDGDGELSWCVAGTDCDDQDPDRWSGNSEIADPNFKDEDCNPQTIGEEDRDGDGFIAAWTCNWDGSTMICGTDCNDNDPSVRPNRGEVCNGKDDNCNGDVDDGVLQTLYRDADGDRFGDPLYTEFRCGPGPGWVWNNTDCDDTDRGRNPRNPGSCP